MINRACTKCRIVKPLTDYYKHDGRTDGHRSRCKTCVDARSRERYHNILSKDPAFMRRNRERGMIWHRANKERSAARIAKNHKLERLACIKHYGNVCACCGESEYEFLSIDHIGGGGTQHRKTGVSKICRWLIKNKFPQGFRILCHNCNQAIGFHGSCPHAKQRAPGIQAPQLQQSA